MKKAFTLLETIISVSIFLIIMIFLYKTLDATKYSNDIFTTKKNSLEKSNNLHNIFLEDLAETYTNSFIEISKDKKNRINSLIDEARKTKNINIRISEYDLEKLREKSAKEGLPYQTLISSIIHKYVSDQLVDEKDIIKSVQLLRFENN